ncbi:MAG TPA: PEP-CTERM sorting domain-containing protein [Pirellulales bacterium]|jgi:hypothetical protein
MRLSFFLLFLASLCSQAAASPIVFTIDPSQSSLTLSPSTSIGGSPLPWSAQGANSLVASYSGTISVDLTANSIQLLSVGSQITAGNSGEWSPGTDYSGDNYIYNDPTSPYVLASAPANYGVTTILPQGLGGGYPSDTATRSLAFALSDAAAKPLVGGSFDEAGSAVSILSGTVFYNQGGSPPITNLAGPGIGVTPTQGVAGFGTIDIVGGQYVLTLPISFTTSFGIVVLDVASTYSGILVATAPVPEPATWALVAVAVAVLGLRRLVGAG